MTQITAHTQMLTSQKSATHLCGLLANEFHIPDKMSIYFVDQIGKYSIFTDKSDTVISNITGSGLSIDPFQL